MAQNVFDKAARYAVKLNPTGFLLWVLRRPENALHFRQWLDTRSIPFPAGTDRTGDTVAAVENGDASGVPWAIAIEFQIEPDPLLFGRMLVYLGGIWLGLKPDEERGSRYSVGGIVVYLTGRGRASRDYDWPEAGVSTQLILNECVLEEQSAKLVLQEIAAGAVARSWLCWIPLMTEGDQPGIVEEWKQLALAEPNSQLRADFAAVAKIFADAVGRKDLWSESLRGWNVRQSSVVNEWVEEGRQEGRQEGRRVGQIEVLEAMLTTRFGPLSAESLNALRNLPDERLSAMAVQLLSTKSLAELGL